MKNSLNPFLNGFFRTLGKTICYIFIGFFLTLVLKNFDFKPIIRNFLFLDVKAATSNFSSATTDVGYAICSAERGCEHASTGFKDLGVSATIPKGNQRYPEILEIHGRVFGGSSYTYNAGNTYQAKFTLRIKSNDFTFNQITQELKNQLYVVRVLGNTSSSASGQTSSSIEKFGWSLSKGTTQDIFYLTITFVPSINIKYFTYYFASKDFNDFHGVHASEVTLTNLELSYSTGTTGAIDQQTQIIQQQSDIINNSINNIGEDITNDDIDEITIDDELNNLQNIGGDSSLGFFSSFLTLPLTWVQSFLNTNAVCNNINLPLPYLKNKTLTLPCMNEFWTKMGALGLLVQACWLCVVSVRIFNGLFVLTVESISTKDNDDELTKIRSWEL